MIDGPKKTISVPEAAKLLGIGRNSAYAAAAAGTIPVIRLGSRMRVPVVALDRMLNSVESTLVKQGEGAR